MIKKSSYNNDIIVVSSTNDVEVTLYCNNCDIITDMVLLMRFIS